MQNKKIILMLIGCLTIVIVMLNLINRFLYVGVVGGNKISRADYKKSLDQIKTFYAYSKQDFSKMTSLDKDILEKVINDALVQNYAKNNGITVTEDEVQKRYLQVIVGFNRNNKVIGEKDEAFLLRIKEMYGIDKYAYLEEVKMDILKEKVQASVKMPLVQWLENQKKSTPISRF